MRRDAMTLKWTRERPTEPGEGRQEFWFCRSDDGKRVELVMLRGKPFRVYICGRRGWYRFEHAAQESGWWAGPIPEPIDDAPTPAPEDHS